LNFLIGDLLQLLFQLINFLTAFTDDQLGIKVWICKGEVYGKRELVPNALVGAQKENNNRPNNAGKKGGFKKRKK